MIYSDRQKDRHGLRRVHLRALSDNPQRVGKPLRGELGSLHSARRGDYRVIYGIVEDARAVEVLHIDRRSDVYRR